MGWLINLKIKLVVKRNIKRYKKYQNNAVKYFSISQEYLRGFNKGLEEIKNIKQQ